MARQAHLSNHHGMGHGLRRPGESAVRRPNARGFSLIELMIAVAIVAILAAVAYPSYRQYLRRGARADAQAHMMDLAGRQGQFLIDNRAYAASVGALGMTTPASVSGKYAIAIATGDTPPSFTITATPIGDQANDTCGTLTLDSAGVKGASGTGTCW
jgi:type IV pilus assembly protein PilE